MKLTTPEAKARFTKAIRLYLDAAKTEAQASAAKREASASILEMLEGETSLLWTTDDKSAYQVTATYGKTSKNLNANCIAAVFGKPVTPECYKTSAPWNEVRISVKA